jgi:hypothetical protein
MTVGHSKTRAAFVSTTILQIVARKLRAWADGDQPDGGLAAARAEIEMLLRDEFYENSRETRDEIRLADDER